MTAAYVPVVAYVPHTPPSVQLKSAFPHVLQMGPLCRTTRWFREIGYTLPILSSDAAFDDRWSVESGDREFAQALVGEREARAALERLRELGCGPISHDRTRWTAILGKRPKAAGEREQHEQEVHAQLERLDGVSTRLLRYRSFPSHDCRTRQIVIAVLMGAALLAAVVGFAITSGELLTGELGPLAVKSLLVSLPLLAALLAISTRLLAGRSTSHKELAVVVLLSLVAVPALGAAAAVLVNHAFDDGPSTVRRVPVLELIEKRNGEDKKLRHYAVVPQWREDGHPTRRVRLSEALARQAVAGRSRLVLTTSPGALKGERLLDLQLEAETYLR